MREISRRLIGGRWQTGQRVEDSGGDSPGGSQTFQVVRVPIAFDDPDILTGMELGYTTEVGDIIAIGASVTTAWDGDNPIGYVYVDGDTYSTDGFSSPGLGSADTQVGSGSLYDLTGGVPFGQTWERVTVAAALMYRIDDGGGGDPESSQGEAELIIGIIKAAA